MMEYTAAYAATAVAMVVLDFFWLTVIAKRLYRNEIGHLMADRPNLAVAALFYLLFAGGIVVFAVAPHAAAEGWHQTLVAGALFGFFAYAAYDLTNLATLKRWPVALSLIDMAWGTLVTALSAVAGKAVLDWIIAG